MNDAFDHDRYNEIAVRISKELGSARRKLSQDAGSARRSREEVFLPFDRPGLGIALEYEQMGNRPVSEGLQARADELGFELEHLGTTLGTVIHGIDLRTQKGPEEVRFIRDTLLERKVIFFRDQQIVMKAIKAMCRW